MTSFITPDGVSFADLKMRRESDGSVTMDTTVLERVAAANDIFLETEDDISSLMARWYRAHRLAGGDPDRVQEDLIAEATIEDRAGQHYSHTPGRS